ncbi:hypothetical protein TNCV_1715021 [Trichonephila clavipes]|nr:hypothetical protein TNCV_1715021 [Trichonephila clavipes]
MQMESPASIGACAEQSRGSYKASSTKDMMRLPEENLKGKRFNLDGKLEDALKEWVSPRTQEFWEREILRLVNQWGRFDQDYGVYFE